MLAPALLCLALLAPFAAKAVHVDDPLFLWSARQIQTDPLDFYGFDVNWYGRSDPMSAVMQNPPGFPYFLALWATVFGWSEVAVHWCVFLFAAATAIGVSLLARYFHARPPDVALISMFCPVFLLSATTAMCDVMMLCFWVWTLVLWFRGVERKSPWSVALAMTLLCAGALTKFFAMALLPLLLVHLLTRREVPRRWVLWLLVPVVGLIGFELWTHELYGQGLIAMSATYAANFRQHIDASLLERSVSALSFAGGSLIPLLFFIPCLWKPRTILAGALIASVLIALALLAGTGDDGPWRGAAGLRWGLILQVGLFVLAGVHLLALAAADVWRERTAEAWLLALWVGGTFVFAGFLFHFVTARTFLTLAPAVGLLIARRLRCGPSRTVTSAMLRRWLPVIASVTVALVVTWSDTTLANSARGAAARVMEPLRGQNVAVWFQGHWGFQFYMLELGARAVDFKAGGVRPGDVIVIPVNNTNLRRFDPSLIETRATIRGRTFPWMTTMNKSLGAGFYSDLWGPAPYVLGRVPQEEYHILKIKGGAP